jgi:heterotetrameric sarcosine oxidase delta subunit
MLLIDCPSCGQRPEGEFTCLGEAAPRRPDPASVTDAEWADWIANRGNVRGRHVERWWHVRSCGRIISLERNTVTHAIGPGREDGA